MNSYDFVVIGSGPAGQKAAIQAAKAGASVLVVEREPYVGGACVHHGTVPSKALRETALSLSSFQRRSGSVFEVTVREDLQVSSLMLRLDAVIGAHERYISDQLRRNGIDIWRGKARFLEPLVIDVGGIDGTCRQAQAKNIVIATGSVPRTPPGIPIDHEHVLDSDSILSMRYLPASLTVLGAGVIACEYASIFGALGVKVVMIDQGARPLGFFDPELTSRFVRYLESCQGRFLGESRVARVEWDGVSQVVTELATGETIRTEKLLCALGRVANLEGLDIEAAGLAKTARGLIEVDAHCQTIVPHVYAAGDVIGPPSLASTSMEQGRRAARHALGLAVDAAREMIPLGIYTIPEMASVGLSEKEAISAHGAALVGRARFEELARGQIAAIEDGLLKLVADAAGRRVLGVQIVGEGATELVHVGQMALCAGLDVDTFVDNIFNFPTLAEAYRVAALDVVRQRPAVG
ncbi:MAG TPA: Si-specific NAD(P)(+) transhydrogenase [Polyangiaceae bacterium]|nr:Si-specific NAD(P)(+) transhydrogenase [Polyangiaceae bacterium]